MTRLILFILRIQRCWLILLMLLMFMVAGCQRAPQSPTMPTTAVSTTFAGIIPDTSRYVALVSNGQRARAYVCDGDTVAEWFNGEVHDGAVDLTSPGGAHLQATVGATGASGSFTAAGGTAAAFTAEPVSAPAGLYRAEENIDGVQYVGGWIVLPGGQTQGALRVVDGNTIVHIRPSLVPTIPISLLDPGTVLFSTEAGNFEAAPVEVAP